MTYKINPLVTYVRLTYFLGCDRSSSVDLCVKDYKSLRLAVMPCTLSSIAGLLAAWCGGQICRPIVLGFGKSNRTQSKTQ